MTMPAGTYWVGDLCYVLGDDWDEVCKLYFDFESDTGNTGGEFTLRDGRRFAMYSTSFGDGTYNDQVGRSYCVDSGTLGCIAMNEEIGPLQLGHVISFRNDFETGYSDRRDSVIKFGHIQIDTDDYSDEE